jgi:phosphoglycolate phosphatase
MALIEDAGLMGYMQRVFTIRDVKNPKPAPDLLNLALRDFGATREEAVYVGDSELDERASQGAGVAFVGFRYKSKYFVSEPSDLEVLLS